MTTARKGRFLAAAAGLLALLLAAPSTPAGAHSTTTYVPQRWRRDKSVTYEFTLSVPNNVEAKARFRNAAATWNARGQSLTFVDGGNFGIDFDPYRC